jgi:hypothetical protein
MPWFRGVPLLAAKSRKLCISHPDSAEHQKGKMRFCLFLHFSIACAIEKWRHIPVPQESLPFAEIP